jgi:hypothetical protein
MEVPNLELRGSSRGLAARAVLFASFVSLGTACATWPHDPVDRALYIDLTKSVELSNDTGWVVDRVQIENNAEAAMRSVCQVSPERRRTLEGWLDGRIQQLGGSAELVYKKHDKDLSAASHILELERVRALLRFADAHATDDCPFWLEPNEDFRGVQSDADRLVIFADTLGYGSLVLEHGHAALGGGGGGRLLFGSGFGPSWTLAIGGEIGGSGAFIKNAMGTRSIETTFSAAIPILLRYARYSRLFDFEIAPAFRFDPDTDILPPGVRTSVAVGFSTMRSAAFMPYALLWLAYEYHAADNRGPADHSFHIGTRVGVDWDP